MLAIKGLNSGYFGNFYPQWIDLEFVELWKFIRMIPKWRKMATIPWDFKEIYFLKILRGRLRSKSQRVSDSDGPEIGLKRNLFQNDLIETSYSESFALLISLNWRHSIIEIFENFRTWVKKVRCDDVIIFLSIYFFVNQTIHRYTPHIDSLWNQKPKYFK